jgi:hypothetical protein
MTASDDGLERTWNEVSCPFHGTLQAFASGTKENQKELKSRYRLLVQVSNPEPSTHKAQLHFVNVPFQSKKHMY